MKRISKIIWVSLMLPWLTRSQKDCSVITPYFVGSDNGCDTHLRMLDTSHDDYLVYGGSSTDPNIVGSDTNQGCLSKQRPFI